MPLSAVIVDDEQLARDELAYLLKNAGEVNVVAQGKNGLEAINLIKEHNPDLVFTQVATRSTTSHLACWARGMRRAATWCSPTCRRACWAWEV